ncbi:serine/threonine-protein kinase H1 isoform X1 [Phyllostomus hastatus]|uniref:serine/threonine-protein kinase H1 isoform X1 n=1 Tax=Phyllostomus hastatus TaxID=9423 RepID=UPI001E6838BD|nr:serine/threonine-protein kinase H1 isoform X1 [Phyllostomus hastatus]
MGCGTSKVLPEPPKDVQLDLVKKVEPFSGTKSDVYKHFITEVDSVGPLKAGLPAASQCANSCPGAPTTGHTEPPSEPPRRARVAKYRAKFDPRVTAKYDIKALIGRGSFSRVVRVEHRATRQPYAIKMIETKYREGREVCESELRVLRRVRHANIIQLVEVFETQERVYMVMELATGGELFDRIIAKGSFTERDATRVLQMVLDGVRYLHALGITHRDLKPENLLYYHPGTDSKIIITDFGLASARKKGDDCLMKTTCGTPEYIAPEVLVRKPYTNSVDMWALGVIAYILLSGTMPFEDDNRTRLYRQILRGKYSYSGEALFPTSFSFLLLGSHPPPARSQGGGFCLVRKPKHQDAQKQVEASGRLTRLVPGACPFCQPPEAHMCPWSGPKYTKPWPSVSNLAKDFIDRLLTVDPSARMTAMQALRHPWVVSMAASSSMKNLHRSISQNLLKRASSRCQSTKSAQSTRSSRSTRSNKSRRVRERELRELNLRYQQQYNG